MVEPFNYSTAPRAGTTLMAQKFKLTNSQAQYMKDSPALAEMVRKIRAKFNTSQSPLTGLSQREMTNPTSNANFLEYLD